MRRGSSSLPTAPLRLGISACLLGQAVRYDGGHKRDPFLAETLGRFVEWVPVCPEVELGLGVPREPIRLEGDPAAPRLVAAKSRRDLTRAMTRLVRARAEQLARLDLVGYVFKKDSPGSSFRSCPSRKKGVSATLPCARASSNTCSPTHAGRPRSPSA